MRFETKIAVAVRDDLEVWQRLNVVAFLISGLGTSFPEMIGEAYEDESGVEYHPMSRQPILAFAGSGEELSLVAQRARDRNVRTAIYDEGLFATNNDIDNRAVIKAKPTDDLSLVGVAVYARRQITDKIFKGLSLHP